MRKSVAAALVSASLVGGAGVGVALFAPTSAVAQSETAPEGDAGGAWSDRREARIRAALEELVPGTITDEQADAVAETLADELPPPGRHGRAHKRMFFALDTVAEALDLERGQLRQALASGDTIAEIAEERGVDVDVVVDALVSAAEERIEAAVEAGRLTEEQAAELRERARDKAEELVNREFDRFRGRPGTQPDPEAEATV